MALCTHDDATPLTVCRACGMVTPRAKVRTRPDRIRAKKPSPPPVDTPCREVAFRVEGVPVTQGSMKVIGGNVVHEKTPELMKWRKAIAAAAKAAGVEPAGTHVPVGVAVVFYLPRPESVTRALPSVKPDLDKLTRAVGDALDKVAYLEDGQVVQWMVRKVYATDDQPPGADVRIYPVSGG